MELPFVWNEKEDLINAARFINTSRNALNTDGDDIDADKLQQLLATAAIVLESLCAVVLRTSDVTTLRSQLEELKKDFSKRLQVLHETNVVTELKKRSTTTAGNKVTKSSSTSSSMSSPPLISLDEKENIRNDDTISGERIYTLLQQQKVDDVFLFQPSSLIICISSTHIVLYRHCFFCLLHY